MDEDLKSTIKPLISGAHPDVKEFIVSGDLEDTIKEIVKEYNLSGDEISDLNDLVTSILIGLGDPDELLEQIMVTTSLTPTLSQNLASSIEDIILSTFASKINGKGAGPQDKQNNVGQSFEQIILNQAKAMQPARLASESVAGRPARETDEPLPSQAPNNLPTGEGKKEIHNYITGEDPYREPVE